MKTSQGGLRFFWVMMFLLLLAGRIFAGSPCHYSNSIPYWVVFTDKKDVVFDPYSFFHPSAIQRRLDNGLCLFDSTDFPLNENYLNQVKIIADTLRNVSRWFNAVSVSAQPRQVMEIESLPFVKEVRPFALNSYPAAVLSVEAATEEPDEEDMLRLIAQVNSMQGNMFHENGLDGSGIRIAILDGGFKEADSHPVFQHLFEGGQIADTWDFHRDRPDVFRYMNHGTMVLSTIAGVYNNQPMGLATGAEFLLARTEIWREPFFEEEYWLAAVEWADRNGAHIINSSLGYSYHRYFPEDMDGSTSLVSKAAEIAFNKGMLVVNSAGNSGDNESWKIISTPADSPYVLTVGSVSYPGLLPSDYSSRGPTADGRLKPNLVAMGNVLAARGTGFSNPRGTSFSAPLVTGFAACLWQMFPEWTNRDLFDALEQSGHLYPWYDYHHGYGIPQAGYFFQTPGKIMQRTFDFVVDNENLNVVVRGHLANTEIDLPLNAYVYLQIVDREGFAGQYYVVVAQQPEVVSIPVAGMEPGQKVVVHYRGFTEAWKFK